MDTVFKLARLLPAVVGIALLIYFLAKIGPPTSLNPWTAAALCAALFVVVAVIRFGLGSLNGATARPVRFASTDDVGRTRQKIAPLIIGIGTGGIAVTALVVILTVDPLDRSSQFMMGIFSAVVPLFATWVGAVIAFYFSNESFRIASEAAGIQGVGDDNDPLTGATRMIPYDKITKIELKSTINTGAVAAAGALNMATAVRPLFGPTVSRVIVFDANRCVVYVLRQKLDDKSATTVTDYLALKQNAADAKNFRMLPQSATVGDGRRALQLFKTADLFVTERGDAADPVLGWVPDDKLA